MRKVYCKNCRYFQGPSPFSLEPVYGEEVCRHPTNFYEKSDYMSTKRYVHWLPVEKNRNSNCELFEKKDPSLLSKLSKLLGLEE